MHFAAATALWGSVTGNDVVRDLGAYLYTTEMHAIEQYWFDVDEVVFPDEYEHNCVGMVWGTKATHETWFSPEPEMIHGINFLPITPASLYLGRHPDYVLANYAEVVTENGGEPDDWVDIMWEYLALADPQTALGHFNDDLDYAVEGGESKAHTYFWLHSLASLGQLDPSVTADTPHFAVFRTDSGTNYVYYNPGSTAATIPLLRWERGVRAAARGRHRSALRRRRRPGSAGYAVVAGAAERYPNPFNPPYDHRLRAPRRMTVSLSVYDVAGRVVAELMRDQAVQQGRNEVTWEGGPGRSSRSRRRLLYVSSPTTRRYERMTC